ncbi:MAG: N-acetyl-gamma-glutamyl-phosphate reductase [Myxococcales bacterium]|nr:N-acetyl-gamma-glutamyl-phosphate reductase [Myxococcales bacterium]
MIRVGVVGARGHVGSELLPILFRHPEVEVAWVTSKSAAGTPVQATCAAAPAGLDFAPASVELLARRDVDVAFLALPNGEAPAWAEVAGDVTLVDLSSDHRFDDRWVYAQPDRFRDAIVGSKRLSCPGCYATAAQLAIAPVASRARGTVCAFGVSGYSGAGTTPSERNDPEVLRDNLLPYSLVGHAHERELRRHLGLDVCFAPHVASFFRGLSCTVMIDLAEKTAAESLVAAYRDAYRGSRFVEVTDAPPRPRDLVGKHGVRVGLPAVGDDGARVVVVAALDNLLAGAASQAVRAMNLARGLDEGVGVLS